MERLARQVQCLLLCAPTPCSPSNVQETQKLLQQPDLDWKDASAAIEELATAVETLGHADSYKDAVRLLVGVSRDIGMQVISIRSRLVKDVCEHLLRIVKVTGRDFQDLANALLPQIVHTAKNSSAAVRQPGAKLLCKVSELVRYDVSLMRKIFAQLTQDKVHVLLLEQLRVIFVYWSDDEVMAWESDVLEMIRQGLDDQNVNVRKTAREVLTTFSSRW
uniref:CLASP N-terminal domain-containing protein n=1 Tax=Phytophthora ramorum TaxID=164328 RepID=H3HB63_PHYRM